MKIAVLFLCGVILLSQGANRIRELVYESVNGSLHVPFEDFPGLYEGNHHYILNLEVVDRHVSVYEAWHNISAEDLQQKDYKLHSEGKKDVTGGLTHTYSNRKLQILFDILFGSDEKELILDTTSYPWRTIGLVRVYNGLTLASTCTGVLIEDDVVLTAANCLYNNGDFFDAFSFSPGEFDGYKPYGTYLAARLKVSSSYIAGKDAFDFGLIQLESRPRVGYMNFGYDCSDTEMTLNIAGYAYDFRYSNYEQLWGDHCEDIPMLMCPFLTDIWEVYHDCDTSGGMSGAPMWQYNFITEERVIRAIHPGASVLDSQALVLTPYVFGTILDAFDDWGI